jgi:hypothetical protein
MKLYLPSGRTGFFSFLLCGVHWALGLPLHGALGLSLHWALDLPLHWALGLPLHWALGLPLRSPYNIYRVAAINPEFFSSYFEMTQLS